MISIHTPRGGSDKVEEMEKTLNAIFQSTLPAGGATYVKTVNNTAPDISIHAPRGGSDRRNLYPSVN